jgi:hypothetical protein
MHNEAGKLDQMAKEGCAIIAKGSASSLVDSAPQYNARKGKTGRCFAFQEREGY